MELTILHLYPEFMSLYGEYANLAVLRRHLEALGVTVSLRAAAAGFVSGMGDGTFEPNTLVKREEAAAMLSRVYTKLGGEISAAQSTAFSDDGSISGWARDAVAFMSGKGIVSGSDGSFNPQGSATIQEALSIALRMFQNLK